MKEVALILKIIFSEVFGYQRKGDETSTLQTSPFGANHCLRATSRPKVVDRASRAFLRTASTS